MTVKEVLGGLGSFSVVLSDETPDDVLGKLGYFGHLAVVRGELDVALTGDGMLKPARYVGVLRGKRTAGGTELSGAGMALWLGDEDSKGQVIENKLTLTNATFSVAINAVLPLAVRAGTIHAVPGTITRTFQFVSPREALDAICDHFGAEWRVNGNATVDAGLASQLYAALPDSIIVRRGGVDLDLVAFGGSFESAGDAVDYSDRVLLLGQTQDNGTFATGSANAPVVPYLDLYGNPVKRTRMISESGETTGTVASRAQLQLNRFARIGTSMKVSAVDYETSGNFVVGDPTWVHDPDTGQFDPTYEITFRGEVLHPAKLRVSEVSWPVTEGHTVAFRTQAGEWVDLTRFVVWETGTTNELVVGDLPRTLTGGGSNPVTDRVDTLPDSVAPAAPFGLALSSDASVTAFGETVVTITAAWDAPTQNADGSALLDLDSYRVRWRRTDRAEWQATTTADIRIDLTPVSPDFDYVVAVAAVDRAGNVSDETAPVPIRTAADDIPPPTPADPVVDDRLGQLRVFVSGASADATPMPPDLNRYVVHMGTTAEFAVSAATVVGSIVTPGYVYATAPYNSARWFRVVAVDNSENESPASGAVTGTARQVVATDLAGNVVGLEHITFRDQGNLVSDGGFSIPELTARRVAAYPGWSAIDDPDEAGTSQVLRKSVGGVDTIYLDDNIPVTAGETIMSRFRIRPTGVNATSRLWIRARWTYRNGGTATQQISRTVIPDGVSAGVWTSPSGFHIVVPADVVTGQLGVFAEAHTAGTWDVDLVEVRRVIGTILITDAAISTAKIADLAVNDAKIANLDVGKLTAGSLTADVTVSGRVAVPALDGTRVELNQLGLQAFAGTTRTFFLSASTGMLDTTGVYRTTATGGRSVIMAGSLSGTVGTNGQAVNQPGLIFPNSATGALRYGQVYDNGTGLALDSPIMSGTLADGIPRTGTTLAIENRGVFIYTEGASTTNGIAETAQFRNDGVVWLGRRDVYGRGTILLQQDVWEVSHAKGSASGAGGTLVTGTIAGKWYLGDQSAAFTRVTGEKNFFFIGDDIKSARGNTDGSWFIGHFNDQAVFSSGNDLWIRGRQVSAGGRIDIRTSFNSAVDVIAGTGGLNVYGNFNTFNGTKNFRIQHPLDSDRDLVHAATESPNPGVHYWGQASIDGDGSAVVELPAYFERLTLDADRAVLVTGIGDPANGGVRNASEIEHGRFTVYGVPGSRFWWQVLAVRADVDFDPEPIGDYRPASAGPPPAPDATAMVGG